MSLPTFSGSTFAGWYFVAQAVAFSGWWLYLYAVPDAVALFIPPGADVADLRAFQAPDLLVAVPASLAAGIAFFMSLRWTVPLAWLAAGAVIYAFVYCVAWSILRGGAWLSVAMMAPAALFSGISALEVSAGTISIFRRASPVSSSRHMATTVVQIVVFWSFFLLVVPTAIIFVERELRWPRIDLPAQRLIATLLFTGFSSLGLVSGLTIARRGEGTPLPFDATNRLVTTGPYAYVRNPMVVAGLGQGVSVALWLGSWAVVAYVAVGGLIWQGLVRPAEERDLGEAFGAEFTAYCARVRCWIPRVFVVLLVAGSGVVSAQSAGDDLLRLTVAPEQLPATCRLNPNPGGFHPTNPALVTNPAILGFMHSVIWPTPSEPNGTTPARGRLFVGSSSARAAAVEIGYAASYLETGGSPEIGVLALKLKDPAAAPQGPPVASSARRITKGPVVIFYWSDARPDAPDRGCFEIVRRHVERINFK